MDDQIKPVAEDQSAKLCQECRKNELQYQCPRCSFRSCSLACCQAHKVRTQCSGKRDRTAFVKVGDMSDATLQNDYHFLEDVVGRLDANQRLLKQSVGRQPGGSNKRQRGGVSKVPDEGLDSHVLLQAARKDGVAPKRLILPLRNGEPVSNEQANDASSFEQNQHNNRADRQAGLSNLQNHARSRGISLLCLPPFMERHKQNETRLRNKTIFWTVEWRVYAEQNDSMKCTTAHQISEATVLWDEVCNLVSKGDQILSKHSFLLKNELSPANNPKYTIVSSSSTLANALVDQTIIEFPTIYVVPPSRLEEFPLSIQLLETADQMKE